jgi:steroid delta-isomerase-like uncharacterized protein
MSNNQNVEIVKRFIEDIWNEGKFDKVDEIFSQDVIWDGAEQSRGLTDTKEFLNETKEKFPDLHFTIQDVFGSDDKVVARWIMSGTFTGDFMGLAPNNKKFKTRGIEIYQFESGKIKEVWTVWDGLSPLLEIGVVVPAT